MKTIFIFLLVIGAAMAAPIENLTARDIWLGDNGYISLSCSEANRTIQRVYAKTTGPSIILPELDFTANGSVNNSYYLAIGKSYFDRSGQFNATVFCRSNETEANASASFSVFELSGYIRNFTATTYKNSVLEADFVLKKNSINLTSAVSFNVSLNNQVYQLKSAPLYDTNRGWLLRVDAPPPGSYSMVVVAFHNSSNVTASKDIVVKSDIEFTVTGLAGHLTAGENFTITFKALDKDSAVDLTKNNLVLTVGSADVPVELARSGDAYTAIAAAPSLSAGKYELKLVMAYKGLHNGTQTVYYTITASGKITDNSKAVNAEVRLILNGNEKYKFYTDSSGSYGGSIIPDVYDVHVIFPQSSIYLEKIFLDSFSDPVRYSFLETPMEGIANTKIYVFGVDLSFFKATLEINYKDGDFADESKLKLLRCSNWNSERSLCNVDWAELSPEIDTVRNKVKVTLDGFSAFVLGTRDSIKLSFNVNKQYKVKEPMRIKGVASNGNGNPIANANVMTKIGSFSTKSVTDGNGVFSFEFLLPEEEGNYTLAVSAEKHPYLQANQTAPIELIKTRSLSITAPSTIKLKENENYTQEIAVVNTGQTDLYNLNVELSGLGQEYFFITPIIEKLAAGEEKKIYAYFFVPPGEKTGTIATALKIYGDGVSAEKTLGLAMSSGNAITSRITATAGPQMQYLIYTALFAIASFSAAFVLRSRKKRTFTQSSQLSELKRFLQEIEEEE